MDARIDPLAVFDAEIGDVNVLRNAGGLVTDDVLRSLAVSQAVLDTREVAVVQHTDCGLHTGDSDALRANLEAVLGELPPGALGAFGDLDASVRASVERLLAAPSLAPGTRVRGYVLDVSSGVLREVTAGAR